MWQNILKTNITSYQKLADFLQLDREKIFQDNHFSLNLPLRLARKMEKGRWDDPLLRQFVPLAEEGIASEGFSENPIGDCEARQAPKLLQKYRGRSLILSTSACAMHCRFCFRKEFSYAKESGFGEEIDTIREDPSIKEVLLSGGDPLSLSDRVLGDLLATLEEIPHVERIRFHTRFLLGVPERIDDGFLEALKRFSKTKIFVFHINHPRELDGDVFEAIDTLRREKILLFSQSVLLRGVNDNVDTLVDLFLKLIDRGIVPYYLHQLDRVKGTAHFEVPVDEGKALMEEIQKRLPGYAIPKYVQEIAGMPHKILL